MFMHPLHCCEHQWLRTALPLCIGQKGCCQSKWDKMSKSSQFHLLCIYQICPCNQRKNWRSRGYSHSLEKGTISLKDSGPLSSPPGAYQPLTNCSGFPCVPWSYCLHTDLHSALTPFPSEAAAELSPMSVAHPSHFYWELHLLLSAQWHPADTSV